jgi:hypothetical protein
VPSAGDPTEPAAGAGRVKPAGPLRRVWEQLFSRGLVLSLLGALILGAVLGGLLLGGGSSGGGTTSGPRSAQGNVSLRVINYPALGMAIARPRGWTVASRSGVIRLASPDGSVFIAVSSPTGAGAGADVRLRRSDKRELLTLFKPARVVGRQKGRLDGRPVLTSELIGTSPAHRPLRILSTAVSSAFRTYSIQVFSSLRPTAQRLLETTGALNSVRFFAPR